MIGRVKKSWDSCPWCVRTLIHVLAALISITFLMLSAQWRAPSLYDFKFSSDSETFEDIAVPFRRNYTGTYWVSFTVSTETDVKLRFFPDDEIHSLVVAGNPVDLSYLKPSDRRNYSGGFDISLPYVEGGQFQVLAQLSNKSNPAGFNVSFDNSINVYQGIAIFLILIIYGVFLTLSLSVTKAQLYLLFISVFLSVIYLYTTDERERIFDVYEGGGHKDYIEYLADNWSLPDPGKGW